jgi:hypothetical protein
VLALAADAFFDLAGSALTPSAVCTSSTLAAWLFVVASVFAG